MRRLPAAIATLAIPLPLLAQQPDLSRLAFMTGCWEGPAGPGTTLEERYTAPTGNVMLGTSRWNSGGRTTQWEFTLVRADSAGIALVPFPGGVRSSHEFRLTHVAPDTAVFEAPEHDYPRRISYRREPAGALVARIDSGATDPAPREWRMQPAACVTGPAAAAFAGAAPRRVGPDRSGRAGLIVFETLNGLWLGVAVPAMFGADDATPYGLGLLLGGPVCFAAAKAYSDAYPVSAGQAITIVWGGWWGRWQALGWTIALNSGDLSGESFFRSTVLGLVGGTAASALIARRPITAGDATLVAHAGMWGTWFGVTSGVLADRSGDPLLAWTLVAGDVAMLAAASATRRSDLSGGRVWLISALGLAGMVGGFGIDILVRSDTKYVTLGIPMATSFAGLASAFAMTRGSDQGRAARVEEPPVPVLLAVRDGRLRFGVPAPQPALLPREDATGRTRWVPGIRATLFELRH